MMFSPTEIARVVHEANREVQRALGEEVNPSWDDLDDDSMKVGLVHAVEAAQRGVTPEESHDAWMRYRIEHGWTYGAVKSLSSKVSPNLVPYADLPAKQRAKDALLIAIVGALS